MGRMVGHAYRSPAWGVKWVQVARPARRAHRGRTQAGPAAHRFQGR